MQHCLTIPSFRLLKTKIRAFAARNREIRLFTATFSCDTIQLWEGHCEASMYKKYYGCSENPFDPTPNPRFFHHAPSHQNAVDRIIESLKDRRGLVLLTGESGTGKTTLVHYLLSLLRNPNSNAKAVYSYHSFFDFRELLETFLNQLNLKTKGKSIRARLDRLAAYLAENNQDFITVGIIDDAQKLQENVIKEAMALLDLGPAVFQMLWVGQPELEEKINSDRFREVKDRVSVRLRIAPLTEQQSREYIEYRLALVGRSNAEVFTPEAISLIGRYARGIPRVLNIVCDNALLVGYALSRSRIDAQIIREVIDNMEGPRPGKTPHYSVTLLKNLDSPAGKSDPAILSSSVARFISSKTFSPLRGLVRDNARRIGIGFGRRGHSLIHEFTEEMKRLIPKTIPPPHYSKTLFKRFHLTGRKRELATLMAAVPSFIYAKARSTLTTPVCDNHPWSGFLSGEKGRLIALHEVAKHIQESPKKIAFPSISPILMRSRHPGLKLDFHRRSVSFALLGLICLGGAIGLIRASLGPLSITSSSEPLNVPPPYIQTSESEVSEQVVVVERGQSLWTLAQKYCHVANEAIVDLILDFNPEITNAHRIKVNQKIKIPKITEELLVTQSNKLTYAIRVGTFDAPGFVRFYTDEPVLKGKEIKVSLRQISPQQMWYRVLIGPFDRKDTAVRTLGQLKERNLLPAFGAVLKYEGQL
jgi:general secretion pathway protein A